MLNDVDIDVDVAADADTRAEQGHGDPSRSQHLFIHPFRSICWRNRSQHERVLGMYGMRDEDDGIDVDGV